MFLDETGSNVAMTRRYARSTRGRPAYGTAPLQRGPNLTVVGAISAGVGVVAWEALDGAMTAARFLAFVTGTLLPALKRGQVVVMDNLAAHKTTAVRAAFAEAGVGVLYVPPYSPEYNPIELCWAGVKRWLRTAGARTREELRKAVAAALEAVEAAAVSRWVVHCGYRLTPTCS